MEKELKYLSLLKNRSNIMMKKCLRLLHVKDLKIYFECSNYTCGYILLQAKQEEF